MKTRFHRSVCDWGKHFPPTPLPTPSEQSPTSDISRDPPPPLPGFHRGVCPRSGEQSGSCDPIGSARWGTIRDHTERGAVRHTVYCSLRCGVSLGFVKRPEIKRTQAERERSGTHTTTQWQRQSFEVGLPRESSCSEFVCGWSAFLILSS